jgi:glycosyltransferase involved in cell wall biosynthesis
MVRYFISGKKTIQTIATLREDLFKDSDFKKILFASKIVTYSKYAKNKLNKLGFNNVEQIYPGIDLNLYSPAPKDNELLKTLNLRPDDFVVTYPGEFMRLRATDDIVAAIIDIGKIKIPLNPPFAKGENNSLPFQKGEMERDFYKNIKFVFACRVKNAKDAIKKEEIQKKLKEKGLLDLVRFPETFTTIDKMLNASDIILFPVRDMKGKFDVPLVVVEAMACKKPVIISDLPILQEFANEHNSVIIKSGDTKQLLDSILDLYQNKEKRETIGKNARIFAEENFDIKKIAERYMEIYRNL